MITIVHTGQTGVERGADRAARAAGFTIAGRCQPNYRDELGPIPTHIAADLEPVSKLGARGVWAPALELVDLLIIAVPTRSHILANAGAGTLRALARKLSVPQILIDTKTDLHGFGARIRERERDSQSGSLHVMIWGPRATRWPEGEAFGRRAVEAISLANEPSVRRVLVVDDHVESAEKICRFIASLGHHCVTANTLDQAVQAAERHLPDLTLVAPSNVPSTELIRWLRTATPQPGLVAAMIDVDAPHRHDPIASEFDLHVVKPVTNDSLRALLERATRPGARLEE